MGIIYWQNIYTQNIKTVPNIKKIKKKKKSFPTPVSFLQA